MQPSSSFYKSLLAASQDNPGDGFDAIRLGHAAGLWREIKRQALSGEDAESSDLDLCNQIWSCATTVSDLRKSVLENVKLRVSGSVPFDSSSRLEDLAILHESHLFKVMLLVIYSHRNPADQQPGSAPEQIATSLLDLYADRFEAPVSVPVDDALETELISVLPASLWHRLARCTTEAEKRGELARRHYSTSGDWEGLLIYELSRESAEALVTRFDLWMLEIILQKFCGTVFGDSAVTQILLALAREGHFDACDSLLSKLPENRLGDDLWFALAQCAAEQDESLWASEYSENIGSAVLSAAARATSIFHDARRGRVSPSHVDELTRLLSVHRSMDAPDQIQTEQDLSQKPLVDLRTLSKAVTEARFEVALRLGEEKAFNHALKALERIECRRSKYAALWNLCRALEDTPNARLDDSFLDRLAEVAMQFRCSEYFSRGVEFVLESLSRMQCARCQEYAIELAARLDGPSMELDGTCRLLDWCFENRALAGAEKQNWAAVYALLEKIRDPERRSRTACDAVVFALGEADWQAADGLLRRAGEKGGVLRELKRALTDAGSQRDVSADVRRSEFLGALKKAAAYVLTDKPGWAVMAVVRRLLCHGPFHGRLDVFNAALDVLAQAAWSRSGSRQISQFEALIQPSLTEEETEKLTSRIQAIQNDAAGQPRPVAHSSPGDPPENLLSPLERWNRSMEAFGDRSPSWDEVLLRWVQASCSHAMRSPSAVDVSSRLLESVDLIEEKGIKAKALDAVLEAVRFRSRVDEGGQPRIAPESCATQSVCREESAKRSTEAIPDAMSSKAQKRNGTDHQDLRPQSGPTAACDSGIQDGLREAEATEPGWPRIHAAIKLAKQSLSTWDLSSQKAAFQWAVQSMTEFLNQIFVRGEPSLIMQEVSSLACLLTSVKDPEFVKVSLESLSAKVLEFPSEMGDCGVPSLGAAFAKIGEFQRALEISGRIESAVERCECLGRIAAELGDQEDRAASEEAFARFETEALEQVSRCPPVHGVGLALGCVLNEFAEKRNGEAVKATLRFLMHYMGSEVESGFAGEHFARIVSCLDKVGLVSLLESTTKELLSSGLLNPQSLETAINRIVFGWDPVADVKTVVILIRCVGSYLHGIPASNQSAILGGCALLVLKQFDGDPDGLKWMTEAVPAETSFDFLCSEQFWRGFEELAPAVRSKVIRCAATLCPFRKDIATWILSEMVRLSLGEGRVKQSLQVGALLGNPKINAFLRRYAQV